MTPEHLVFIPTVFLLGFLSGVLAVNRREGGLPVLLTLGIVVGVFGLTHLTSFPYGARALHNASGGLALFDQRPSFSASEVVARLDAFGPGVRGMYQRMTTTGDVLFPLSLLLFFIALARYATAWMSGGAAWRAALLALPLAWFGTDMLENGIIYALIAQFPSPDPLLAVSLAPVTVVKMGLLPLSLVAPLLAMGLGHRRRRHEETLAVSAGPDNQRVQ